MENLAKQKLEKKLLESLSDYFTWVRLVWVNSRGNKLDFSDRPYLEEIYRDQHPNIVYIKAAQCFPPGTRIKTPNGDVFIENIREGQIVYGHDGKEHKVINLFSRHYEGTLKTISSEFGYISSTQEHPFLIKDGDTNRFTEVKDIAGQAIFCSPKIYEDGFNETTGFINELNNYSGKVYNFEVEGSNSYIANNYAVHNCGLSERVLSETVWVAEQLGKIVLYTFPASSQLQDFTQARLDPVFQHSDYLAEVYRKSSTGVQKIELKKVGDGYIYFRGSQNEKQIISIDADMIVLDERDRFTNTAIPFIDKRTLASDLRWRRELSTPTVPGFGIDEAYKNSDQRVWQLECKKCGLWQEIDFFKNIDHQTYRVHCNNDECNSTMDRLAKGKWQPLKPELSDEIHGYRISGIFNPRRTVKEIVDDYYKSMNGSIADLEQFYNQTLGMPFQMDGMKLNKDDLDRCKRDYRMPYDVKPAYAGCDVGSVHNITVSIPTGKDKDGNQKMKLIWAGKVNNFFGPSDSIEYIMKKYDIKLLVIDKNPETSSVMKLIEMFPGRVFAATYPSKNFTIDNYIMWDDIIKEVKVDRTISLDYLVGDIQNERIELPENISFIDDFYEQMCSAVRVSVKNNKTGEVTARWVEEKSDHFFHTLNYNRLAILKGGVGQALVDYYKQPEEGNFNSVSQMVQWVKINGKRIF